MRTASLSSGSKGNSVFVESAETRILIDDGLSLTNIEARLKAIEVDPAKVTRTALENAVSVSKMILTTESIVTDKVAE